jgi:MFS transporter, DHA1 family, multidrug resistance protein
LDDCDPDKRAGTMGIFNGLVTLSMAFAPVLGSWVNLYAGWRGNFWILFLLSLLALIGGFFTIPNRKGNDSVVLSPMAYKPLLFSRELMIFIFAQSFLSMTYWLFVAMAPLFYMNDLRVPPAHFGFYQGSMCGVFSIVSLLSPRWFKRWGQQRLLILGMWLCALSSVLFVVLSFGEVGNPLLITSVMLIFSVGAVFPCNILYPTSLEILPNSSARAAALLNSLRLLLTAAAVQGVGIFYDGSFFPIGMTMFFTLGIGIALTVWAMRLRNMASVPDEAPVLLI